jgi:hypothetical protein
MTGQSVMMKLDTSARTHGKNATGTVKIWAPMAPLTDDGIHVAISYREEDLDDRQYCANIGVSFC